MAAVTHAYSAASLYGLHPEDYRGRLAALHRAIDDADQYVRAQRLLPESGMVSQPPVNLDDSVRMGPPELERFEQAIQRWRLVHRPILAAWSDDVYPWWDDQLLPFGPLGERSTGGADYWLQNLRYFEQDLRAGRAWQPDEEDEL